jgi:hypothetical protein
MPADIARDLAATGRMADMDGVLEIQVFDELGQIVGVGVHIVTGPGLARAAVTATVVANHAVTFRCHKTSDLSGLIDQGRLLPYRASRLQF